MIILSTRQQDRKKLTLLFFRFPAMMDTIKAIRKGWANMSKIVDLYQPGKTLLIYNPRAGRSTARPQLSEIVSLLQPSFGELVVQTTLHPGHARELAQALGKNYDTVICCGGDGTLNETIDGLLAAGAKAKVGYIPIGSTNDLAKNIGVPTDLQQNARQLARGETHGYDVGQLNGRCFTYFASFGPGVSVSYSTPQKMKNALGYSAYMINGFLFQVIPTLQQVKPKHIRITYDGHVIEDDFYFGAVSNAYSVAGGMFRYSERDVRFNDGLFEVMLVRRLRHATQIFPMLYKMHRHDYDGKTLLLLQAKDLTFEFSEPVPWTLDGEFSGNVTKAEIHVLPGAIQISCDGKQGFLPRPAVTKKTESR